MRRKFVRLGPEGRFMRIPALIRPIPDGGYRASSFDVSAEGPTSHEAIEALRARLQALLDSGTQIVNIHLPEAQANPWTKYARMFEGDPWFDRWQAAIAENRRQ